MREILFRGKTDKGEWVIGNLMVYYDGSASIIESSTSINTFHVIFPETVGQYTGLTDKNGNKIFEGDIVKTDKYNTPNKRYVIKYDLLLGAFIGEDNGTMYFTTFDGDSELFEIIGNIHDTPELLNN